MSAHGPVVHVSTALTWRGGEQQLLYLAERVGAAGVPQFVVCRAGSRVERVCRERGVPVAALAGRTGLDPLFARTLARAAARERAAVVHAHDAHAHASATLAVCLFGLAAPVVVDRRVDFPVGRGPFSRWKYEHRRVRRILCASGAIADIVRRGIRDHGRVCVVHDGIDLARFERRHVDGRLRREYRVPSTVPIVGNVAALVDHKDLFTFVDTASLLTEGGLDARFFIIGEGPRRERLLEYVREKGLDGRVFLTGFRDDVPNVLPELDVFLFTSSQEGLGSSILDAYACRVPVIATAAGGVPEVVSDAETGLLAPVRDAAALAERVQRLLGSPALRARIVEGGAARVANFTADRMAERTLAIYREVRAEARS
jgi:glycosyltransferase involved in cell wall biosynthesis